MIIASVCFASVACHKTEAACVDTNGYWDAEASKCICFQYDELGRCDNSDEDESEENDSKQVEE